MNRFCRGLLIIFIFPSLGFMATGCFFNSTLVINDARDNLASLRQGTEKFYYAQDYLEAAKEEQAEGDLRQASFFGRRALGEDVPWPPYKRKPRDMAYWQRLDAIHSAITSLSPSVRKANLAEVVHAEVDLQHTIHELIENKMAIFSADKYLDHAANIDLMGLIWIGDKDGDGIPDEKDHCPTRPETYNGYQDEDGCPDELPRRFTLQGIHFELNKSEILPGSEKYLKHALEILRRFPEIKIRIAGHTDSKGSKNYNQKLSLRRAKAVRAWLISRGVLGDRIAVKGWGESKPVASNENWAGRAMNRRIEFVIIEGYPYGIAEWILGGNQKK